ncbi:TetR/AcrR family transcriptional regulator [Lentzea terrae]|uniref:TetR/AcrR family transcriptional regulator n=1 Tax=Lentzea terrae TaxID=2200761 RepID=UPI000DD4B8DE|nr:TetR/AcrR family transcriptional regulator [Lentzea terrae]
MEDALPEETSSRSDARRNRKRLLDAATHVLRAEPATATMHSIARRAALSQATAYRHFPSVEALIEAYHEDVIASLAAHGERSRKGGKELFEQQVARWVKMQNVHGPVIVRFWSQRGFLERMQSADAVTTLSCQAWDRSLREVLIDLALPDALLSVAQFLCHALLDPREIIDLKKAAGLPDEQVVRRLSDAFYGALRGWALSGSDPEGKHPLQL